MTNQSETKTFSSDVEKIYRSSLNGDNWPFALEALCETLNASKAQLLYINSDDLTFSFASGYGFDPYEYDIGASKFRRYLPTDPIALYALDHPNTPFSDELVIPREEKLASPMQTDIRDPANMHFLLTVYLTEPNQDDVALIFFRGKEQQPFSQKDVDLFSSYLSHLKQACKIHKAFTYNQQIKNIPSVVLDSIKYGVIVVDESRNIVIINRSAQSAIEKITNITIRNGKLACLSRLSQQRLSECIHLLFATHKIAIEDRKLAVRLTDETQDLNIFAIASNLKRQCFKEQYQYLSIANQHYTSQFPNKSYAMLVFPAPDRTMTSWTSILRKFFNLTSAETSLACKLAQDCSLKEAATQLGRSVGTARVQLQSIFDKTDTHSQSSLIKLLMTLQ